ncbi:MAG: hypothetical protein LBE31_10660, partial [Deltaproteobacteria bacterium]|nr:hypothetical protein [Deltaproteobacteria bacterium]
MATIKNSQKCCQTIAKLTQILHFLVEYHLPKALTQDPYLRLLPKDFTPGIYSKTLPQDFTP